VFFGRRGEHVHFVKKKKEKKLKKDEHYMTESHPKERTQHNQKTFLAMKGPVLNVLILAA